MTHLNSYLAILRTFLICIPITLKWGFLTVLLEHLAKTKMLSWDQWETMTRGIRKVALLKKRGSLRS